MFAIFSTEREFEKRSVNLKKNILISTQVESLNHICRMSFQSRIPSE